MKPAEKHNGSPWFALLKTTDEGLREAESPEFFVVGGTPLIAYST